MTSMKRALVTGITGRHAGGLVEHDNEPTLRDLIELIRRGLPLAGTAAVVAVFATFLLSRALAPTFEAQATVVTSPQDPNQRSFGTTLVTAPPLDAASYRAAIASRSVLADALRRVDGGTPTSLAVEGLGKALTVRSEGTNTASPFRRQVRDGDSERARDLANAIAAAAVAWDEQRATRSLEAPSRACRRRSRRATSRSWPRGTRPSRV